MCYVIEILYMKNRKEYKQKFISLHSMSSQTFVRFKEKYFKEVMKIDKKDIVGHDGELGSQSTISIEGWEKSKEEVLKGITEREKCY